MNKGAVAIVEIAERVQKQIATARVVGKFAVRIGWSHADRAIRKLSGSVAESSSVPTTQGMETEPQLAIVNYQHIAAVDVIAQLETLSSDQLCAIAEFESAHRKRRTVLHKISQLLSTEHPGQS